MSNSEEYVIKLKNATISQNKIPILSNVNIEIKKGEFVYLIGKTGSGKSSLLKTLYADIPIVDAEVAQIGDFNLKTIKTKKIPLLRRKLGIVFQDFQLLSDRSVEQNLLFVLRATGWTSKQKMLARANEVLTQVGLTNKGYKMPNELSGGEQQRVVIARALLNNPEIIIADEPTGNLDNETSEGIIQLLFNLTQTGTTVLLATHNYNLFRQIPARTLKCENNTVVDSVLAAPVFL